MKQLISILTILIMTAFTHTEAVALMRCDSRTSSGGVDAWPWSVAQPFPWSHIEGYWQVGDLKGSFIRARVLSSNPSRKILSVSVYDEGLCEKPYARGTGYIDATERNVVRALVSDGIYKYQLKFGLFNAEDVNADNLTCGKSIMGFSMQIIGHQDRSPVKPELTQAMNAMLKKVTVDLPNLCKRQ